MKIISMERVRSIMADGGFGFFPLYGIPNPAKPTAEIDISGFVVDGGPHLTAITRRHSQSTAHIKTLTKQPESEEAVPSLFYSGFVVP